MYVLCDLDSMWLLRLITQNIVLIPLQIGAYWCHMPDIRSSDIWDGTVSPLGDKSGMEAPDNMLYQGKQTKLNRFGKLLQVHIKHLLKNIKMHPTHQ